MWNWLTSWIPGPLIGMTGTLEAQVNAELGNDAPIPNPQSANPPRAMVNAPANNLGALYRGAYWLAVAARIAIGRGRLDQMATLREQSNTFLNRAHTLMATRGVSVATFGASPSGTDYINAYLQEAENILQGMGYPDAANVLTLQQQKRAQRAQQAATEGRGLLSVPGVNIDSWIRSTALAAAGSTVVGAVAVVGVGLWLIWPWLAPILRLGSVPLRARKAQNKRRKKRRTRRRART